MLLISKGSFDWFDHNLKTNSIVGTATFLLVCKDLVQTRMRSLIGQLTCNAACSYWAYFCALSGLKAGWLHLNVPTRSGRWLARRVGLYLWSNGICVAKGIQDLLVTQKLYYWYYVCNFL